MRYMFLQYMYACTHAHTHAWREGGREKQVHVFFAEMSSVVFWYACQHILRQHFQVQILEVGSDCSMYYP